MAPHGWQAECLQAVADTIRTVQIPRGGAVGVPSTRLLMGVPGVLVSFGGTRAGTNAGTSVRLRDGLDASGKLLWQGNNQVDATAQIRACFVRLDVGLFLQFDGTFPSMTFVFAPMNQREMDRLPLSISQQVGAIGVNSTQLIKTGPGELRAHNMRGVGAAGVSVEFWDATQLGDATSVMLQNPGASPMRNVSVPLRFRNGLFVRTTGGASANWVSVWYR